MSHSHTQALNTFARRLERLLVVRSAVQLSTVWFFVWGVAVLAWKISGTPAEPWLPLGVFGFAPLVIFAAVREHRRQPALSAMRANYDRLNRCGGVMMAGEVADMSAWQAQLPAAAIPALHWHGGRALSMLALSLAFAVTALWLPERFAHLSARHSLEIGGIVGQLKTDLQVLQQEKIVDDKKADEIQKQLSQLKQDSSAVDPDKTWEALDHIKEANSEVAKQAADEAVTKTTALAQAETMGLAMEQAADEGMSPSTAETAAQTLSAMLKSAKLEEGLLKSDSPQGLPDSLNNLSQQDLENLMKSLENSKNSLNATVGRLSEHRLIDASKLAQCRNAGQHGDPNALAEYLSTCTNGCSSAECERLGKGGPGRGGPGAPMTWTDGASEKDQKFKEHLLPEDSQLNDATLVGVSRSTPQVNKDLADAGHGALNNTAGSGGSAQAQVVLPEHRQAVQNYFKRDGN